MRASAEGLETDLHLLDLGGRGRGRREGEKERKRYIKTTWLASHRHEPPQARELGQQLPQPGYRMSGNELPQQVVSSHSKEWGSGLST